MLNNINKDDLNQYSDEKLSKLYKKITTVFILEKYLKTINENNIEVFPKDIFGSSKIDSIEEHLSSFQGTKKGESLLDNIYIAEKEKFHLFEDVDRRNERMVEWVDNIKSYVGYETEEKFDNAENFLELINSSLFSIQKKIEALNSLPSFEKTLSFYENGKDFCYTLADSLVFLLDLNFDNKNIYEVGIHLHANYSDLSKFALIAGMDKEIIVDKKENSLSDKLFGNDNEMTSSEKFLFALKKIFVMHYSQMMQVLNNNVSIQYQKKATKQSVEKIAQYIESISKIQELKILGLFRGEDISGLIAKEKNILRQLVIKNILFYNKNLELSEIKDLGKYF